jgi:hypothetical protein
MPHSLLNRLDALAWEHGMSRARFVRRLVEQALGGAPVVDLEPPTEDELLALLAEKARAGNVAACRTLLVREEQRAPRSRVLEMFREMTEERSQ